VDLTAEEIRVLGCLVEKRLTTPQQYPLTLNALTLACNQTSNRDPVVEYDEAAVEEAVTSAKTKGFAAFVHPSHGRSALRFRHTLDERLGLDVRPLALLGVLMLRGPQTPGELRGRSERLYSFDDIEAVDNALSRLAESAFVKKLPRQAGFRESRYAHLLSGDVEAPQEEAPEPPASHPSAKEDGLLLERIVALEQEFALLRREFDDFRRRFE